MFEVNEVVNDLLFIHLFSVHLSKCIQIYLFMILV